MREKLSFLFSIYHFFLAFLGNIVFGFPSKKIFVFGITGTKGKSTVIELINFILEKAGYKTSFLSSLWVKIDEEKKRNLTDTTMPGRFFIQRFLRKAVNKKCQFALIEITSQGIVQHRHRFIDWNGAMFLNLTPEHIEAHKGFENYKKAKANFFTYVKKLANTKHQTPNTKHSYRLFFINQDDPNAEYFIKAAQGKNSKIILFSKENASHFAPRASRFMFVENIAPAFVFCREMGVEEEVIKKAIEEFPGVRGRMEIVQSKPFMVIIDYAHTPDSLHKVYQNIRSLLLANSNSKMICVLGSAGGGRDKWKRPKMGEIAGQYCDKIILTNEDPYNENPNQILSQIKSGISNFQFPISNLYEIIDRRTAIKKALELAKFGDVVIITGKGYEPWIHYKNKRIPWDERKVVERELSI